MLVFTICKDTEQFDSTVLSGGLQSVYLRRVKIVSFSFPLWLSNFSNWKFSILFIFKLLECNWKSNDFNSDISYCSRSVSSLCYSGILQHHWEEFRSFNCNCCSHNRSHDFFHDEMQTFKRANLSFYPFSWIQSMLVWIRRRLLVPWILRALLNPRCVSLTATHVTKYNNILLIIFENFLIFLNGV